MRNIEAYKAIGKEKKQEGEKNKWAKETTKHAKEAYKRIEAGERDKKRESKHEAAAAKWNERKGKIQETGRNVLGRIGKTVETASLLRRALPEIGKDALTGLKQGAENKIGQLMERGSEAFNKCSARIERARFGVGEMVDKLRDAWKMRQIKKSMEKCASIGQNIGEKYGELRSQENRDKIEKRMRRLRSVFELNLIVKGGDPADVSKSLEQGFAMAT